MQCHTSAVYSYPSPISSPAYGVGFAAILVISLVSLLGVCLVPLIGKSFMQYLTSFLVAMGVSALVCDAVLHLIPHVRPNITMNHVHSAVYICYL